MLALEHKYCPRCGTSFECKVGDVGNCWCGTVKVSQKTLTFLKETSYDDCLCSNCITAIDQMMAFKRNHSFPAKREHMVEGLHYYMDNGYFVFTELYHMLRGYCCGNHCRHCAYGNENPET